jgi:hypothetical protein
MALLAANKALLGRITPNIRLVSLYCDSEPFTLYVYVDGDVTEEIKRDFQEVAKEIHKLLPTPIHIDVQIISKKYPQRFAVFGNKMYRRKESILYCSLEE